MDTLTALILSSALVLAMNGNPKPIPKAPAAPAAAPAAAAAAAEEEANHIAPLRGITKLFASPSDSSKQLLRLTRGEKVEAIRMMYSGNQSWLYVRVIEQNTFGWIHAGQADMTDATTVEPMPEPIPEPTKTTEPTPTYYQSSPRYLRMGIVTNPTLNIRTAPGVNNDVIGKYYNGNRIGFLEIDGDWGRTPDGWVCLDYVYLEGDSGFGGMYGWVNATALNIRTGPGMQYPVVGNLQRGDRISILAQVKVGNSYWGCTSLGWVHMAYISSTQPAAPATPPPVVVPGIGFGTGYVNNSYLNVRVGPGTIYPVITTFHYGDVVTIMEVVDVNGVYWGRTSAGWVCMNYISLVQIFTPPASTEPTTPGGDSTGTGTGSGSTDSGSTGTGSDSGSTDTGSDSGSTGSGSDTGSTGSGSDTGSTGTGSDSGSTGTGSDTGSTGSGSDSGSTGSGSDTGSTGSGSDTGSTGTGSGSSDSGSDSTPSAPTFHIGMPGFWF